MMLLVVFQKFIFSQRVAFVEREFSDHKARADANGGRCT
jgi:hypothetical protein